MSTKTKIKMGERALPKRETAERRPKLAKFKVKFHHLRVGDKEYSFNDIAELDPAQDWVKRAIEAGQLEPVK